MIGAMVEAAALVQMGLLGEALERGPVAVFVFDDRARYVAVNGYACELLGYEREELLAMRAGALSVSDDPLGDYAAVVRGDLPEGAVTVRRKDGTELLLRFRACETKVASMTFYVGVAWPAD